MEFFRIINVKSSEKLIQDTLNIQNLEIMSEQLVTLGVLNEIQASIGSIWGEFTLERSKITGGLRFLLKECPNALTWSITTGYEPVPNQIVVHLTINRTQKDKEFLLEIEDFLDNQSKCLENLNKLQESL